MTTRLRSCGLTVFGFALSFTLQPGTAEAQRAVDVQLGSWEVEGPNPALYSIGYSRGLIGPLGFGLRGLAVIDRESSARSLYGLAPELSLFRGARRFTPYAVGGVGLAVQPTSSPDIAALWYAGLGMEWNPVAWLGLAIEGSYLAEDVAFRGFWDLRAGDRQGWATSARFSVRWGGGAGRSPRRPTTGPPPVMALPSEPIDSGTGSAEPLDASSASLAGQVVNTALDAMGEPYRWGGTSTEKGFDCSGLVWYAYTNHGISVPRVSRDQARAGRGVPRDLTYLEPGDILLFASDGRNVSHVGLYVGDGRFIHSTSSGGVRVGELHGRDGDDQWWRDRWVGARRILN